MKKLQSGLYMVFLMVLVSSSVWAAEPQVLASATFLLDGKTVWKIHKILDDEEIYLIAKNKDNREIWRSTSIGTENKFFQLEDVKTPLSVADLNGDNRPEIISAAFYGPKSSGLYIYKFDKPGEKLELLQCYMPGGEPRECVVSDMHQEDGSDFLLSSNGDLRVLGLSYEDEGPKPARWEFKLTEKGFVLDKKLILPSTEEKK